MAIGYDPTNELATEDDLNRLDSTLRSRVLVPAGKREQITNYYDNGMALIHHNVPDIRQREFAETSLRLAIDIMLEACEHGNA